MTLTETEKMSIIAKAVSDQSLSQWRDHIRLRKLGIANGRIELEGTSRSDDRAGYLTPSASV